MAYAKYLSPEFHAWCNEVVSGHMSVLNNAKAIVATGKNSDIVVAPSARLAKAFEAFKTWLKAIYHSLSALNAPLTNDIRGVMDRMLASGEEIAQAEAARSMGPLFGTAEAAGMTPEEFAAYHAQGVAVAAAHLGVRATIVMPEPTPAITIDAVRRLGGALVDVVLHGENFDEASARARALEAASGAAFIHPFDDPDVIAGQGTVGLEILRQHPAHIDAIFCCVGGGGLLAGVSAFVKRVRPRTLVVGVEAEDR
jgi:hypothetical protein